MALARHRYRIVGVTRLNVIWGRNLAEPGRVLGRFINDMWPAATGPGRFIGLFGRVFSGRF